MKKALTYMNIILVLLALLIIILAIGYNSYHRDYYTCESDLIIHAQDARIEASVTYYFQGKKGVSLLKGAIIKGEKVTTISRKNHFRINKNDKGYLHLVTTQTLTAPSDEAAVQDLQRYLPDFYFTKNASRDFVIHKQGDGLVFSTGYMPAFYCVKE